MGLAGVASAVSFRNVNFDDIFELSTIAMPILFQNIVEYDVHMSNFFQHNFIVVNVFYECCFNLKCHER